jgi:hypothetical protein
MWLGWMSSERLVLALCVVSACNLEQSNKTSFNGHEAQQGANMRTGQDKHAGTEMEECMGG